MSLPTYRKRTWGETLLDYFRGFCIGTADLIPGISGGTIAFIFGIYEELVDSISAIDGVFFKHLGQGRFREAFRYVNAVFLCAVFGGDLTAIFVLSKGVHWLLMHQKAFLEAFFFGLITATIPIIAVRVKRWSGALAGLLLLAAVGTYFLTGMVPLSTPTAAWFIFISGALAICAMILPGISGAFILVLLGKYDFIITALSQRNFLPIGILFCGVVVGLLTFVRLLRFLLHRYHDIMLAVLTGLVAGSLRKVWPWKVTETFAGHSNGVPVHPKVMNVLPPSIDQTFFIMLGLMVLGFAAAYLLAMTSPQKSDTN